MMALMPDGSFPIASFEDIEKAVKVACKSSDTLAASKARSAVRDLLMKAMYYDQYANGAAPVMTPAQLAQLQRALADYNLQVGGEGGDVHVRKIRPRESVIPAPLPPAPPAPPNVYGGTVATTFTRATGGAGGYYSPTSVTRHPTVQEIAKTGVVVTPAPEGVHLLAKTRIGDAVRDRYLDHLRELFSTGHMTEDEFSARQDATMKAETRDELEFLIRDLPALPAPPDMIRTADPRMYRQVTVQQAARGHTALFCFWAVVMGCTVMSVPLLGAIAGFLSMIYMIMAISNFSAMKKVK